LIEKIFANENILDGTGRLLVAKGTQLSQKNLNKLKLLGITHTFSNPTPTNEPSNQIDFDDSIFHQNLKLARPDASKKATDILHVLVFYSKDAPWNRHLSALVNYTNWVYNNSLNVALLSLLLGVESGLCDAELHELALGALLHDVGYILIPKNIILSSSKYDEPSRQVMQQHCELGAIILSDCQANESVIGIIRQHHERLDGSGYPHGLTNADICFNAKIVMIADTFISLTNDRPHRLAYSLEESLEIIYSDSELFDPVLLAMLKELLL
jgi:putative nucleotidyltransferase with HDIG domain